MHVHDPDVGADAGSPEVNEKTGSGARGALEAWLEGADQLLEQQRSTSISPSFATALASDLPYISTLSLEALEAGLGDVVGRLVTDPGRWILILEFGDPEAKFFVQFLVYEDGSLVAETVSDAYLEAPYWLTDAQAEALGGLGWTAPKPPSRPNWLVVEDTREPDVAGQVQRVLETLRVVFALAHKDEVRCKLFSSSLRGDTPASERPAVSGGADDEHRSLEPGTGVAPAVLRLGHGHRGDLEANSSSARAGRAWLLAAGLGVEIERLRRPLGQPPIAAPGLEELLEIAQGAAIGSHEGAVEAHEAAMGGDWDEVRSSRESAENFAELAERTTRQIAMLALGVSAWHPSDLYIEATDRAAVTVLSPGIGLGQVHPGELELYATKRSELVTEIAGLLCVLLIERTLAVRVGPARIWCDGSDTLHVALDGHDDDLSWPSPVSVWVPATLIAERIVDAGTALPPIVSPLPEGQQGLVAPQCTRPARSERAARRCPRCREQAVVEIVYGLPSGDLFESAERGEVALGGCVAEPDQPRYACTACRRRFRSLRPVREVE